VRLVAPRNDEAEAGWSGYEKKNRPDAMLRWWPSMIRLWRWRKVSFGGRNIRGDVPNRWSRVTSCERSPCNRN